MLQIGRHRSAEIALVRRGCQDPSVGRLFRDVELACSVEADTEGRGERDAEVLPELQLRTGGALAAAALEGPQQGVKGDVDACVGSCRRVGRVVGPGAVGGPL
jgi:hypothetical protein